MHLDSRPLIFVVCLALLLVLAARFYDHTVDDAFISFRYADNLVAGQGLVFNAGERVEGYTNFLWVVLVAPFMALGADPETVAKLLGLAATGGLLAAVVRFAPRSDAMPELRWLAPLLTATSPPLLVWATGGLETPLYACLVTWAICLGMRSVEKGEPGRASAWVVAAATLTRPDGLGVALALVVLLALLLRGRPGFGAGLARWCAIYLGVVAPYTVWRVFYYGDLLPNTFHAKVGGGAEQLARGVGYLHAFFDAGGYWMLVPLAGLVWLRDDKKTLLLGAATAALLCYPVLVGGDSLPMFRFVAPALPPLFLLVAFCATAAVRRFAPAGAARGVVALAALALVARAALPAFHGEPARLVESDRREVSAWEEIGVYFGRIASPGDSIAVITAGAIPYYSKLETIDMLGLTDRTIARREQADMGEGWAGHEKFDVEYVLDRRPTYVVVGTYGLSPEPLPVDRLVRPFYPAELALLRSRRFHDEYRAARGRTDSGFFAFFVRADRAS